MTNEMVLVTRACLTYILVYPVLLVPKIPVCDVTNLGETHACNVARIRGIEFSWIDFSRTFGITEPDCEFELCLKIFFQTPKSLFYNCLRLLVNVLTPSTNTSRTSKFVFDWTLIATPRVVSPSTTFFDRVGRISMMPDDFFDTGITFQKRWHIVSWIYWFRT